MVFMPKWPKVLGNKPINFGLERTFELLKRLGNPHESLPPVIHVAGTNGKGSTIAFLKSIFETAGYKVHAYTSPHLLDFNERIYLAGSNISDNLLDQLGEECCIAAGDMKITFFEGTTVLAFLAFSRVKADVVLLETGMGGRLDSTNVIDNPACTVLTPISLDHTEFLGPNIPLIAGEKVGILKKNVPCVSSLQFEEAHLVIERKAQELEVDLFSFGYDWVAEKTEDGMVYKSQDEQIDLPRPSLLGDHQILNAGTAIAAVKKLKDFEITDEHIGKALENTKWLARMQQLKTGRLIDKLPQGWEIWLDGAHNNAGAHILSCVMEDWDDKPTYIICGFTRGRDAKEFLNHFREKAKFVCGLLVETEISAQDSEVVSGAAKELNIPTKAFDSIEEAVDFLPSLAEKEARIIICGSLYLSSDALKANL